MRAQWLRELEGSCLRYTVLDNTRKLQSFNASTCDVALVGSTVYKRLAADGKCWRRLIFDEADSYLFPGMKPLPACFTWLVTATWGSLRRFAQARRSHAMRRMLAGAPLETLVIDVPSEMGLPPIRECLHEYRCATSLTRTVAPLLSNDVMTRIEAGDIVGAIESLGGDASTTNIVELVRGRLQRKLDEARFRAQHNASWRARVADYERQLSTIDQRFETLLQDEACSICMGPFVSPVLAPCLHVFCTACLVPWLRAHRPSSCPQCRSLVNPEQLTVLQQHDEDGRQCPPVPPAAPADRTPTRMEHVERLVGTERQPEQRILIFSEHDATLLILRRVLQGHPYAMLQGHASTRDRTIREYKSGVKPILLLNSRMHGAGLDLPETTDIVLFHNMPEDIETQVIARGHRMGQTRIMNVHRFVPE